MHINYNMEATPSQPTFQSGRTKDKMRRYGRIQVALVEGPSHQLPKDDNTVRRRLFPDEVAGLYAELGLHLTWVLYMPVW